mmetsp:Transcript_5699/g.12376  ORF Transcript_5699/g.12376 Transcript_5699/m.12376 type:complete len:224 (+) Transcript_5699:1129-1800(+)
MGTTLPGLLRLDHRRRIAGLNLKAIRATALLLVWRHGPPLALLRRCPECCHRPAGCQQAGAVKQVLGWRATVCPQCCSSRQRRHRHRHRRCNRCHHLSRTQHSRHHSNSSSRCLSCCRCKHTRRSNNKRSRLNYCCSRTKCLYSSSCSNSIISSCSICNRRSHNHSPSSRPRRRRPRRRRRPCRRRLRRLWLCSKLKHRHRPQCRHSIVTISWPSCNSIRSSF